MSDLAIMSSENDIMRQLHKSAQSVHWGNCNLVIHVGRVGYSFFLNNSLLHYVMLFSHRHCDLMSQLNNNNFKTLYKFVVTYVFQFYTISFWFKWLHNLHKSEFVIILCNFVNIDIFIL